MRHVDIKTKIAELLPQAPDWDWFVKLGNLTKLRQNAEGDFHHANYESGLLLYALVRHFKPTQILEIGTGRGYGAFCMARGLRDNDQGGRVITLDIFGYTEPQAWILDDGGGARIEQHSLKDVWERYLDPDLRALIEHRQCFSAEGMAALRAEGSFKPQLIYIDGDHSYTMTRHDLYAAMLIAEQPFRVLLDDYHPRSNLYGVRRLVDDELSQTFELEAIYQDRRWYGEPFEHVPLEGAPYAQVLLDSARLKRPLSDAYPASKLRRIVDAHQRWGKLAYNWEYKVKGIRKRLGLLEHKRD